ncbi:MAG: branched-chain-amino-acid transaminase [Candidatus Omnitrophota bacterium]|jgi:branched-chain amino acid aminotransferase
MGLKVYLNGKFVEKDDAKISIFDHGLLYGDGVFEGIRSYNRRVFRFMRHLERMYNGAEIIRLDIPMAIEEFRDAIIETLKVNDLDNAYIRAVVTRGPGDLGLDPRKCKKPSVFIITDKIALYPKELYENGLPIVIAKTRRNHPRAINPKVKSLNYLNNIFGKIDAIDAGTEEALMLTIDGYVAECTGDNIFIAKDRRLMTPPSEIGALEGITQQVVAELAEKRGIKVVYSDRLLPEDIYGADECFLTGTAAEIIPVVKVDQRTVGSGKPGEITKILSGDFKEFTKTNGVEY